MIRFAFGAKCVPPSTPWSAGDEAFASISFKAMPPRPRPKLWSKERRFVNHSCPLMDSNGLFGGFEAHLEAWLLMVLEGQLSEDVATPFDALERSEIDEVADTFPGQPHVIEKLGIVLRQKL